MSHEAGPYVRFGLPDQAQGATTGGDVVEEWLDRLSELRQAAPASPTDPDMCLEVLAVWLGARRLRPSLVTEAEPGPDLAWLNELVEHHGADLARAALSEPLLAGWLEAADALDQSYHGEEEIEPLERARQARELLEGLDDAELVVLAAERLGVIDETRAAEVEMCVARCAEQPDLFLAAASFIRATGESLRPDLVEVDPELSLSAEKFVRLLDELEDAVAEVTLSATEPWPAAAVPTAAIDAIGDEASLLTQVREWLADKAEAVRAALAWRPALVAPVAVQVTATPAGGPESGDRLEWRAADGSWAALLRLPPATEATDEREVTLRLRPRPAGSVAVMLCGVVRELEVNEDGAVARYRIADLRANWDRDDLPTLVLVKEGDNIEAGEPVKGS